MGGVHCYATKRDGDTAMTTLARPDHEPAADPLVWSTRAACAGHPELTDERTKRGARRALELCAGCPVIAQCRAWADSEATYVGVAGGRVYVERRTAA